MADEFHLGSGNWWDTSRTRFDGETTSSSSNTLSNIGSYGWATEMAEMKPPQPPRPPSVDSVMHGGADQNAAAGAGVVFPDQSSLQLMGLGLDWNPSLFRSEKGESSFRSMIQEDLGSNASNFQAEPSSQEHWTQKIYSGAAASPDDSTITDFRQINRGFSLDQPQFSSPASSSTITTGHNLTGAAFQLDSAYGLLLPENQPQPSMNFPYPPPNAAGLIPSWNKFPQSFLRTSPPKQAPPPTSGAGGTHLHFTNNTPFWNASAPDPRSTFFPDVQSQIPNSTQSLDEKTKNSSSEARDSSSMSTTTKKTTTSEASNKRARNEAPSPLPAFKVRKEKMGDRITALQQLVSPFGKTDTASVLSEAIEYIKFLHEQVSVLSTPYMKNGAPIQNQQNPVNNKSSKDPAAAQGPRQDLRSRGLCLVPVSSTFPMTHETTVDFWTPTFGGSFR